MQRQACAGARNACRRAFHRLPFQAAAPTLRLHEHKAGVDRMCPHCAQRGLHGRRAGWQRRLHAATTEYNNMQWLGQGRIAPARHSRYYNPSQPAATAKQHATAENSQEQAQRLQRTCSCPCCAPAPPPPASPPMRVVTWLVTSTGIWKASARYFSREACGVVLG